MMSTSKAKPIKPRSEVLFSPLLKKGHRHKKEPSKSTEKRKHLERELRGFNRG